MVSWRDCQNDYWKKLSIYSINGKLDGVLTLRTASHYKDGKMEKILKRRLQAIIKGQYQW